MRLPAVLAFLAAVAVLPATARANQPCYAERWSPARDLHSPGVPAGCPLDVMMPMGDADGSYVADIDGVAATATGAVVQSFSPTVNKTACGPGAACGEDVVLHPDVAIVRMTVTPAPAAGQHVRIAGGSAAIDPLTDFVIEAAGPCPDPQPYTWELCGDANCYVCVGDDSGLCDGGVGTPPDAAQNTTGDLDGCSAGGAAVGWSVALALGLFAAAGRLRRRVPRGPRP